MTTRELRKALIMIDDQEITVRKLRELLFELDDQDSELDMTTLLTLALKSRFDTEFNGEVTTTEFSGTMGKNKFFRRVAKAVCFADCGDYYITNIFFRGKRYYYSGWAPGMVYNFKSDDGDEWEESFPEWDH